MLYDINWLNEQDKHTTRPVIELRELSAQVDVAQLGHAALLQRHELDSGGVILLLTAARGQVA